MREAAAAVEIAALGCLKVGFEQEFAVTYMRLKLRLSWLWLVPVTVDEPIPASLRDRAAEILCDPLCAVWRHTKIFSYFWVIST